MIVSICYGTACSGGVVNPAARDALRANLAAENASRQRALTDAADSDAGGEFARDPAAG